MRRKRGSLTLAILALLTAQATSFAGEFFQRFETERLLKVRVHLRALEAPLPTAVEGWLDIRAVFHCHSSLSHDSRGSWEQIAAAAHKAGVRAVFMSEHPRRGLDVVAQGLQGVREGVLFIPGIEHLNFLVYPRARRMPRGATPQDLVRRVRKEGGLVFIAHPETFEHWELAPQVNGMEIYNIHSNVKPYIEQGQDVLDRGGFFQAMQFLQAFRRYPREAFGMLFDEPADFLRRWDEQNKRGLFVGVAGNDAHSNIGFWLIRMGGGRYEVWDALEERVLVLSSADLPLLDGLKPKVTKGVIMELHLDPYERSFGYVSTHLLVEAVEEEALRRAAARGRGYVAFDWMADPTGFRFETTSGETMGEEVRLKGGTIWLTAQAPLAARYVLYRDGEAVAESVGSMLRWLARTPGAYRVEVHLPWLDGGFRPWIYSNPIFVREA